MNAIRVAAVCCVGTWVLLALACSETSEPPDSSGRMTLSTDRAAPGELVDIRFPGDVDSIGAGFNLDRWEDEQWRLKYTLHYAGARSGPTPEAELPTWQPAPPSGEVYWVLIGIGITPGGPVTVRIPETAQAGHYRICEGVPPSREPSCANIEVAAQ
jgi:hypothetical protein